MIRLIKNTDYISIMEVYNYYVTNSFYTFSNMPMTENEAKILVEYGLKIAGFIVTVNSKTMGFGIAYPYREESAFRSTIELTYFLNPEYVGKGIGSQLYLKLYKKLKSKGYKNILVNISSLNKPSLKFHKKLGFLNCGTFKDIGILDTNKISVIWMQKKI